MGLPVAAPSAVERKRMQWDDPDDTKTADRSDDGESEAITARPEDVEQLTDRIVHGLAFDLKVSVRDAEETIEVDVDGPDRDYLVDHRGEALNALQYLLNRIVYRGQRGKKIHVDSGGYRKVREDEIVEIALRTAEKVKSGGEECVMSPLNPYERRLVHLALGEVAGVGTRSLGDSFLKRIAIYPDDEPEAGEDQSGS